MPNSHGRRDDFDVDDTEHREFRAEAERLVELWRTQKVDVTEVDLTEESWTTTSESSSSCSPRNATAAGLVLELVNNGFSVDEAFALVKFPHDD